MTAPMTSREELPSEASLKFAHELDDEMRAGLGIGELALRLEKFAAGFRAPAQGARDSGDETKSQAKEPEADVTDLRCGDGAKGSSRHVAGRTATTTSENLDVTAGETAPTLSLPSTGLPAPAPHAAVREAREKEITRLATIAECAALVEQHQETITETSHGSERGLSTRRDGNQMGLAYATGIRALAGPQQDGGGK